MGDIYIDVIVTNIIDMEKQKEITFLVDTGASRSWITKEDADYIGVKEEGIVPVELADGQIKKVPYGCCKFVYDNEIVAGNVIIGPSNIEPILGTHVLQDFRMVLDMTNHSVAKGRALKAR